MSVSFTKLFSSITESTVWCEPMETRLCWITMLAMADRLGRVWASVPGLANRARVSLEGTESALKTFLAPDAYSRTPDHDGRRIEAIDGGWRLLNHAKYRAIKDDDVQRERKARNQREHRLRVTNNGDSHQSSPIVTRDDPIAEAEAEAEAEAKKEKSRGTRFALDSLQIEWMAWCSKERPDLLANDTFERFCDYWQAMPGQKGVKLDWFATWRNWVRNEKPGPVKVRGWQG